MIGKLTQFYFDRGKNIYGDFLRLKLLQYIFHVEIYPYMEIMVQPNSKNWETARVDVEKTNLHAIFNYIISHKRHVKLLIWLLSPE